MSSPVITIYVRHAAACKYAGDEFSGGASAGGTCGGPTTAPHTGVRQVDLVTGAWVQFGR
jgi:hypothetical protein